MLNCVTKEKYQITTIFNFWILSSVFFGVSYFWKQKYWGQRWRRRWPSLDWVDLIGNLIWTLKRFTHYQHHHPQKEIILRVLGSVRFDIQTTLRLGNGPPTAYLTLTLGKRGMNPIPHQCHNFQTHRGKCHQQILLYPSGRGAKVQSPNFFSSWNLST